MESWVSPKSHSRSMTPFFQRPIVTMLRAKRLPVRGIVLSPIFIVLLKVPILGPGPCECRRGDSRNEEGGY